MIVKVYQLRVKLVLHHFQCFGHNSFILQNPEVGRVGVRVRECSIKVCGILDHLQISSTFLPRLLFLDIELNVEVYTGHIHMDTSYAEVGYLQCMTGLNFGIINLIHMN